MEETTWLQLIVILNFDYLTTVQDFKWSVMRFDHCSLQRRFSSRKRRSHTFDTQHETICNDDFRGNSAETILAKFETMTH